MTKSSTQRKPAKAPANRAPSTRAPSNRAAGKSTTTKRASAKNSPAKKRTGGSAATAAAARKAAITARSGVKRREPKANTAAETYPIGKGRKALKGISIYMHPLAKEVLDKIAQDQRRTVQDLGLEALNLLFQRYGEKPIA